jgi:hypothetical protein
MDNLIYILIGIAWVAYSLYTARQKAIQRQQSTGLPPRGPSQSSPLPIPGNQSGGKTLFEDIFRELSGEPRPVPQPVSQPVTPVKHVKPKDVSELNQRYEGHSGYKFISGVQTNFPRNEAEHEQKKQQMHEKLTSDENLPKRFDLREAVIFSELLNRKYF